ncbi:hypothetical protein PFISCL1PPCAC_18708, partial [Pristionchus fissidentatus]
RLENLEESGGRRLSILIRCHARVATSIRNLDGIDSHGKESVIVSVESVPLILLQLHVILVPSDDWERVSGDFQAHLGRAFLQRAEAILGSRHSRSLHLQRRSRGRCIDATAAPRVDRGGRASGRDGGRRLDLLARRTLLGTPRGVDELEAALLRLRQLDHVHDPRRHGYGR